ncbi:hypothetical protein [Trinickia sp. Y13]|uniref:hypothetical protein n=1 Tax=Trinickia sp. Y13 TaxID=2917807 RepID=UPI002405BC2C|nr:hypothetical protein [Trinickia sp. Y13]MDG0025862.1 VWA domain-containing protein [Trinickia sp. Y13]
MSHNVGSMGPAGSGRNNAYNGTPTDQAGGAAQAPEPRRGGISGFIQGLRDRGNDAPSGDNRTASFSASGSQGYGISPQSSDPAQNSAGQTSTARVSFLKTPEERVNFYKSNELDPSFITPEEAGLIADKQPIIVVDTSGSMETIVTKTGLDGAPQAPEPRFKEQLASGMQLLKMLNAFSKQPTRLYDLKGGQVNEASPEDPATRRLFETIGGVTPLAATLKKIENDLKNEGTNKRVVIYISTDGDATDVTDSWGYFDKAASRLAFETQLRHMIDDGIVSDDEAYRRQVYVSIQYVGDDDEPFAYPPVPPGLSEEQARQFLLDAVRREGSAGAYYAALDDEKRGGIKNLDVFDDIGAEMRDAQRAGYAPTIGDLTLKKMVGPLVPRLDNLNERPRQ